MNCGISVITLIYCIQFLFVASYYVPYENRSGRYRLMRNFHGTEDCKADAREPWSYTGRNGPKFWGESFPGCNGREQSPIAISSRKVVDDPGLHTLAMKNYDIPVKRASIENTGRTVELTPTDGVERTIIVKGSTYRLNQLHFHWGDSYHRGAEHIIDGTQYALELHLVHENANNQIAVVAVIFQEQSHKNSELQTIIKAFPKVMFRDMRSEQTFNLNLNKLLPANPSSFYRYTGSLTTPECNEGVTWSVLTKSMYVGKKQMAEFRSLYSATKSEATPKCKLVNNYRPVQPLNQRKVYISH